MAIPLCSWSKAPTARGLRRRSALRAFSREVTVDWTKRDRYKRIVGKILDGEHDVNLALVRDGMCWWYRKYANEQSQVDRGLYEAAEVKARTRRVGLWSDPEPVPPWEWRHR
jgi:endonuclease YncB( thermonuclease family)